MPLHGHAQRSRGIPMATEPADAPIVLSRSPDRARPGIRSGAPLCGYPRTGCVLVPELPLVVAIYDGRPVVPPLGGCVGLELYQPASDLPLQVAALGNEEHTKAAIPPVLPTTTPTTTPPSAATRNMGATNTKAIFLR